MLGNDILNYVDISINADGVKFSSKTSKPDVRSEVVRVKSVDESEYGEVVRELAEIYIASQIDEIDLYQLGSEMKKEILNMIEHYNPIRPKTFPVKMKILLKDEIPIAHNPRRMSYADQRIVDQQVADWLKEGIVRRSFSEYHRP